MSPDLIQYLQHHEHDDPAQLVLSRKEILGYPAAFVANQLDCRRRAKEKLPTWYSNPEIVYPPKQNLEQCSSEATAKFKCDVVSRFVGCVTAPSGGTTGSAAVLDLTGGFGVDSFFFSRLFEKVFHVEPNAMLCQLAKSNHLLLGARNVEYATQKADDFLSGFSFPVDCIYLDPSRKSEGKKVVLLSDCEPNVIELLPKFWNKTNHILIKAAPLLDIKEGLKQLAGTAHVWVVSVNNECKEVLFHLQKDFQGEPSIHCVNIHAGQIETFAFTFSEEVDAESAFSEPLKLIYEPNASILKAGAFKLIGQTLGVAKLATNTHLYTSHEKAQHFPGRVFKVLGDISAQAKLLPEGKANIISRNHPLNPEAIKKKYKLKDGGEQYVLAFSGEKKKYLLVVDRLQ